MLKYKSSFTSSYSPKTYNRSSSLSMLACGRCTRWCSYLSVVEAKIRVKRQCSKWYFLLPLQMVTSKVYNFIRNSVISVYTTGYENFEHYRIIQTIQFFSAFLSKRRHLMLTNRQRTFGRCFLWLKQLFDATISIKTFSSSSVPKSTVSRHM